MGTESGQLLLDTCKHADVLQYVHALNQQSAVTYDYMFGDKDTFRLAFAIADKLEAFNQVTNMPGAAFASKESSAELQRVHRVNRAATEGGLDIFEQASARCDLARPAFLHRTNAEFSLRNNQQILTEFILAPRSSEEAKALLWHGLSVWVRSSRSPLSRLQQWSPTQRQLPLLPSRSSPTRSFLAMLTATPRCLRAKTARLSAS